MPKKYKNNKEVVGAAPASTLGGGPCVIHSRVSFTAPKIKKIVQGANTHKMFDKKKKRSADDQQKGVAQQYFPEFAS